MIDQRNENYRIKKWLDNLPEEFNECEMVFRKITTLDDDNWSAFDKSIVSCGIDVGNNEAYFCDEESYNIMKYNENNNNKIPEYIRTGIKRNLTPYINQAIMF